MHDHFFLKRGIDAVTPHAFEVIVSLELYCSVDGIGHRDMQLLVF